MNSHVLIQGEFVHGTRITPNEILNSEHYKPTEIIVNVDTIAYIKLNHYYDYSIIVIKESEFVIVTKMPPKDIKELLKVE